MSSRRVRGGVGEFVSRREGGSRKNLAGFEEYILANTCTHFPPFLALIVSLWRSLV